MVGVATVGLGEVGSTIYMKADLILCGMEALRMWQDADCVLRPALLLP